MEKFEVKILSYIRNFRKVLFICPLCRENNSFVIENEAQKEFKFKCDCCRKDYIAGVQSLEEIIKSMS
ncbi:MAG: hypothetical protein NE327_07155 [Lentisphaeraceae bacterium]|nr:hypothetical protein [Lentisphaeraceae bacterium]